MDALGELRDLDVASTQTLPGLAGDYAGGDERRARAWEGLVSAVAQAASAQRHAVRAALEQPAVGAALIAAAQWLEALPGSLEVAGTASEPTGGVSLRRWARHRLRRMRAKLQAASKRANDPAGRHRVRILAKRLRYGVEALRTLLPERRAKRWQDQAAGMQTAIGAARDVIQAATIASRLSSEPEMAAFLRGVAVGLERGE
jgi:CHAD domain-containing protein